MQKVLKNIPENYNITAVFPKFLQEHKGATYKMYTFLVAQLLKQAHRVGLSCIQKTTKSNITFCQCIQDVYKIDFSNPYA